MNDLKLYVVYNVRSDLWVRNGGWLTNDYEHVMIFCRFMDQGIDVLEGEISRYLTGMCSSVLGYHVNKDDYIYIELDECGVPDFDKVSVLGS